MKFNLFSKNKQDMKTNNFTVLDERLKFSDPVHSVDAPELNINQILFSVQAQPRKTSLRVNHRKGALISTTALVLIGLVLGVANISLFNQHKNDFQLSLQADTVAPTSGSTLYREGYERAEYNYNLLGMDNLGSYSGQTTIYFVRVDEDLDSKFRKLAAYFGISNPIVEVTDFKSGTQLIEYKDPQISGKRLVGNTDGSWNFADDSVQTRIELPGGLTKSCSTLVKECLEKGSMLLDLPSEEDALKIASKVFTDTGFSVSTEYLRIRAQSLGIPAGYADSVATNYVNCFNQETLSKLCADYDPGIVARTLQSEPSILFGSEGKIAMATGALIHLDEVAGFSRLSPADALLNYTNTHKALPPFFEGAPIPASSNRLDMTLEVDYGLPGWIALHGFDKDGRNTNVVLPSYNYRFTVPGSARHPAQVTLPAVNYTEVDSGKSIY